MIFRTQANETRTVREAAKGRAAGRPPPIRSMIRSVARNLTSPGAAGGARSRDEIAITNLAGSTVVASALPAVPSRPP